MDVLLPIQVLIFRLLVLFTKGNPTLSRRLVLVSALRESKKIMQVRISGTTCALYLAAVSRIFVRCCMQQ